MRPETAKCDRWQQSWQQQREQEATATAGGAAEAGAAEAATGPQEPELAYGNPWSLRHRRYIDTYVGWLSIVYANFS